MSAGETTLAKFLNWDEKSHTAQIGSNLDTNKEKIVAEIAVPWESLREKLVESIAQLLNLPLKDFCLAAWKKHEELQQFADPDKYPPEESNQVNLLEHEIIADYHPTLEVSLGGKTFPRLKFDLQLSLKFEGCVLTIQAGMIKEILPGTCQGLATLEWKEFILAEAKTGKVDLGDTIKLGKGVEISAV